MDYPSSPISWLQGWNEIQQQAWKTWTNMAQENMTQGMNPFGQMFGAQAPRRENPFSPEAAMRMWRDGANQWMRFVAPPPEETPQQALFRHMYSAGENFLRMGQQVFSVFNEMQNRTQSGEEWTEVLNRFMQQAQTYLGQTTNWLKDGNSINAMGNIWKPLEYWQQAMANIPGMPTDMSSWMPSNMTNPWANMNQGQIDQLLATPGLGYTREMQAEMQLGIKYIIEHQQAVQEFSGFASKVGVRAINLLHQKLLEYGANDKQLDSLKSLFDLWVECGEQAHQEISTREDYAEANARLANTSTRVKNHTLKVIDKFLVSLNLPNRSELNTVHRQLLDMKRQMRSMADQLEELQKKGANVQVDSLRDEIEQMDVESLRRELQALRHQVSEQQHAHKPAAPVPETSEPVATAESTVKRTTKPKKEV